MNKYQVLTTWHVLGSLQECLRVGMRSGGICWVGPISGGVWRHLARAVPAIPSRPDLGRAILLMSTIAFWMIDFACLVKSLLQRSPVRIPAGLVSGLGIALDTHSLWSTGC